MEEKEENIQPHYYQAHEVFKPLNEYEFRLKVLPFIRAYYKHEYGEELMLHSNETGDLYLYVHVDRDYSMVSFHYCKEKSELSFSGRLKKDKQKLKPKNILNFLYYEYKLLFENEENETELEIKKKITL
jgi:hypothetical protein